MRIMFSPILHIGNYCFLYFFFICIRTYCNQCLCHSYGHDRIICKTAASCEKFKFLCLISPVKFKWTSYDIS